MQNCRQFFKPTWWERSGRVLDSRPGIRASQASLHCGPWAIHIYPSLVLVQPRKTCPLACLTERLLMGRKESNKKKKLLFYNVKIILSKGSVKTDFSEFIWIKKNNALWNVGSDMHCYRWFFKPTWIFLHDIHQSTQNVVVTSPSRVKVRAAYRFRDKISSSYCTGLAQTWKELEFRGLSWKVLEN